MGDFHSETHIKKARKEHTCSCCHSKIQIGAEYYCNFGIWFGDTYSYKLCTQCKQVIDTEWATGNYRDTGINIEYILSDLEARRDYYKILREVKEPSKWLTSILERWDKELFCRV